MTRWALLLLVAASGASAEVRPVQDKTEPRLAVAKTRGNEAIRLAVPIVGELTVLFPDGAQISGVTVNHPADWQAIPDNASGSLSLRALRPAPDAEMTVLTGTQSWRFVLTASPDRAIPRLVRIVGEKRQRGERGQPDGGGTGGVWRVSGNRELRPSSIRDDGAKTYLEWRPDQALPAVFALDRLGREEIVNGYMRGTVFTIDRVYDQLVFRIDKAHASARLHRVRTR